MPSIFDNDPLYRKVGLETNNAMDKKVWRDDWWELPTVLALACLDAWILLGGWRGVGLILLISVYVTFLLLEQMKAGKVANTVVAVATLLMLLGVGLYVHLAWQTM